MSYHCVKPLSWTEEKHFFKCIFILYFKLRATERNSDYPQKKRVAEAHEEDEQL